MWWMGVAHAANLRDELARAVESKPEMAAACSSAEQVLSTIQRLAAVTGQGDSDLTKLMSGELPAVIGSTRSFSIAMWGLPKKGQGGAPQMVVTLETPLGFEAYTTQLAAALEAELVVEGERRKLVTTDETLWAEWVDGRVRLSEEGAAPPPSDSAFDPAVLSVIPETGGCAFALAIAATDKSPPASAALFAPFREAAQADPAGMSATFALKLANAKPNQVVSSTRRPVPTSPIAPLAVAQVGIVLDSFDLSELEPDQQRAMKYVARKLPLDGGVVALFATPPGIAAELPLTEDWSANKAARRARKLANKLAAHSDKVVVAKTGPSTFDVVAAKPLTVEGVEGGLRVYTSPDLFGPGAPWLSPADVQRAGSSHLFLWFDLGQVPSFGMPAGKPMSMSLTAEPSGVVSGTIVIPFTAEEFFALGERLGSLAPR